MICKQSFYKHGDLWTLLERTQAHALYRRGINGTATWMVITIGRRRSEVPLGDKFVMVNQEFLHLSERDYGVNTWQFPTPEEAEAKYNQLKNELN